MTKIKAKPITNQFWILQKDNKKIGQVTHNNQGYSVNITGFEPNIFSTLDDLKKTKMFEITELPKAEASESADVIGYPTEGIAYNALWNLKYKLPLFTTSPHSKSWHAAGYYRIMIRGTEEIVFCPKLITLQRNKYTGPFKEKPDLLVDKFCNIIRHVE